MINFDINKFKIFNQLYDYQNGNMLLQHIAAVLKKDMRENELFTHTGADDFDVLIEYSSDEDIIGRILSGTRESGITASPENGNITCSFPTEFTKSRRTIPM